MSTTEPLVRVELSISEVTMAVVGVLREEATQRDEAWRIAYDAVADDLEQGLRAPDHGPLVHRRLMDAIIGVYAASPTQVRGD